MKSFIHVCLMLECSNHSKTDKENPGPADKHRKRVDGRKEKEIAETGKASRSPNSVACNFTLSSGLLAIGAPLPLWLASALLRSLLSSLKGEKTVRIIESCS